MEWQICLRKVTEPWSIFLCVNLVKDFQLLFQTSHCQLLSIVLSGLQHA